MNNKPRLDSPTMPLAPFLVVDPFALRGSGVVGQSGTLADARAVFGRTSYAGDLLVVDSRTGEQHYVPELD